MPALTRRRDTEANQERWTVYSDVRVGNIGVREWTARTFEDARTAFAAAWPTFLAKRTEANFEEWRPNQAWTAEKYRRFDRGERMPHDWKPACY